MNIGCPKEIMNGEYRVALTPASVVSYVKAGHKVLIEHDAGFDSGFTDGEYAAAGAEIASSADEVWAKCGMIIKVHGPMAEEFPLMREHQTLFSFFNFAANREMTEACLRSGAICVAYELVEEPWGLPLLQPMSEIGGRMSVLMGAYYLGRNAGGSGVLATGVPGVAPAKILIVGGGTVGTNAARIAAGLSARVVVMDVNHKRIEYLSEILPANCVSVHGNESALAREIEHADIVIGAILLPGGAATPKIITREHLRLMRPGSVFVDVAIDAGGIAETSRPTTHGDPVFVEDGVIHYCVTNMPGAYSRTATMALSNVTTGYGLQIANHGTLEACRNNAAIEKGLGVCLGKLTLELVAEELDMTDVFADADAEIYMP